MSEKQKLIQEMLKMQRKFTEHEHDQSIGVKDYFAPSDDHPLAKYSENYNEMANRLVDLAHAEKGSKR